MKRSFRIAALLWVDVILAYIVFFMQDYLTDVWKISFTHAAAILNIWEGISKILPVFFQFLAETILGNFTMLTLSTISSSVGIALVTIPTLPVFGDSTCKQNEKAQCIGHAEKALFYTGIALLAAGRSGLVSAHSFAEEQERISTNDQPSRLEKAVFNICAFQPWVVFFTFPYIKNWSILFGFSAIYMASATLLYLSGWHAYNKLGPKGGPMTEICRGLCSASAAEVEVEAAKFVVHVVPIWSTFIICGVVSSTGTTYFVEQANGMNTNIEKWKVSRLILFLIFTWAKDLYESSLKYVSDSGIIPPKYRSRRLGIGVAMAHSVACCLIAAPVELKRLKVMRSHDLLDKPNDSVPMSAYWLLFQYVLLGGLDSILEENVASFYEHSSQSMRKCLKVLSEGVLGLGFMCGVLSIYVVGKISEIGGKRNWLQYTLNTSRLDRYYWVLAALSFVNLLVYIWVAPRYKYKKKAKVSLVEKKESEQVPPAFPAEAPQSPEADGRSEDGRAIDAMGLPKSSRFILRYIIRR